jgi:hypothetical protein
VPVDVARCAGEARLGSNLANNASRTKNGNVSDSASRLQNGIRFPHTREQKSALRERLDFRPDFATKSPYTTHNLGEYMNRMQFYPDEKSIATDWISKSISSQVRRGHFIFAVAAKQQIFTTRSLIFYPGGSHWRDFYRGGFDRTR